MNRDSLRRYAETAYRLLWGDEPRRAVTVRPGPGLAIVLTAVDGGLTLRAITEEQPFQPEDIAAIGEAFTVGAGIEPEIIPARTITHPISRRAVEQYAVVWRWREVAA